MQQKEFYNYIVFENGEIYSNYVHRFLNPDITKHGYKQVTLYINGNPKRFKVHRLVALLWLGEAPKDKPTINHKDGNKLNNNYTNLEYATYYENNKHARDMKLNDICFSNSKRWENPEFRERTSKNISQGLIKSGCTAGKNNGRFRYEIRVGNGEKEYNRKELAKLIKRSQSYTDSCIRKASNGEKIPIFEKYNIKIKDIKQQS